MTQLTKEFIDDFSHIVFVDSKRDKSIRKELFSISEFIKRYSKIILSILIIFIGLLGLLHGTSLLLSLFALVTIPM